MFGAPSSGGGFGLPPSTSSLGGGGGFGSQSVGGFGNTNASRGFGAAPSNTGLGFGNPPQAGGSSLFSATSSTPYNAGAKGYNPNGDLELPDGFCPNDTITSLKWSENPNAAQMMIVGAWDNGVRIYGVEPGQTMIQGRPKPGAIIQQAAYAASAPVFDVALSVDTMSAFSACADGMVNRYDLNTSQAVQIGKHEGPVRNCFFVPQMNCLVTSSFDKTIRFWDLRSPNPAAMIQLRERCYALDVKYPFLVAACGSSGLQAGRNDMQIQCHNLQNMQNPFERYGRDIDTAPLKLQYRCVSIMADNSGFAVGGVEGRVAIRVFGKPENTHSFAFKCHRNKDVTNGRESSIVYSVNSISFHPGFNTFSTAGSDGSFFFWDKDKRERLKSSKAPCKFGNELAPITASAFNSNGTWFAYSVGYQWDQGVMNNQVNSIRNTVMIHNVEQADIAPKQGSLGVRR